MVGSSGSQGTRGHERVIVIDDSFAPRLRRALRAHALHSQELRRFGLAMLAIAVVAIAVGTRDAGPAAMAWSGLLLGVPYALLFWAGSVWLTVRRWARHFTRELAPGRMLGLSIGSHSVRVRDHDSANEYAYATIKAVEVRHGVVLVRPGSQLWALPVELFDPVDLGLLQARAGQRGVEQALLD